MTDFEDDLRRRLTAAADGAPPWRSELLTAPAAVIPPADRRRRPGWLVAAAAAAVVVGGGAWWVSSQPPTDSSTASCAGVLRYAGATYTLGGPLVSVPAGVSGAGTGTVLGCDDGGGASQDITVGVQNLPGIERTQVVTTTDGYWVAEGVSVPDALQPLLRPAPCEGASDRTLDGVVVSIDTELSESAGPTTPYSLGLEVDGGDVPGGFARTTLEVAVTATTRGAADRTTLLASLRDGARVRVTARCVGTGFEAVSLARG